MENTNVEIIYRDEYLVVLNKPVDLPVHKNGFMPHDAPYLNKIVGSTTGKEVYNVHRIDAKTSGIVVLAFSPETARQLTIQFERREVAKRYIALVLGVTEPKGECNTKVLVKQKAKFWKGAQTHYNTIKTIFTGIEHKDYKNTPVSLVSITPVTGRWHQIRQHFAQQRHDIIGDTSHGDFLFNKKFMEHTGIRRLFLHAQAISFIHPASGESCEFETEFPTAFNEALEKF